MKLCTYSLISDSKSVSIPVTTTEVTWRPMVSIQQIKIVSISLYQTEGLGRDLMMIWLFGKQPLDRIQSCLQIYIPKRKLCFFSKRNMGRS